MNKADTNYIVVGKLGKTYGIHGWLKVDSYMTNPEDILSYQPWYLQHQSTWEVIQLQESRILNNNIIVKLSDIHTPEAARLWTGKLIALTRSQLPELKKDEFYWSDLEGLTVLNKDGQILGRVAYLLATGSNDVLVVKGSEREYAIPYLKHVIVRIDLEKKEIHVDWDNE